MCKVNTVLTGVLSGAIDGEGEYKRIQIISETKRTETGEVAFESSKGGVEMSVIHA